ncbi:MAG: SixA phosphatase family protein [Acidimicrobiales bacterium]
MLLYLIRHAHAGTRAGGPHDRYRPLSPDGQERAETLAGMLADRPIATVLSSPATRCVQTVEGIATGHGLAVIETDELFEGSRIDDAEHLLAGQTGPEVVACSHGDLIPELVEAVARRGAVMTGDRCRKGSIWILEHRDGRWTSATYVDRTVNELPDRPGPD